MSSSALTSHVPDGKDFRRGRSLRSYERVRAEKDVQTKSTISFERYNRPLVRRKRRPLRTRSRD
jgi:metal-dependent HD superfamily phosphatase/phosphodiesterase